LDICFFHGFFGRNYLKDKNIDQLSFSHNGGTGHLMLKVPYAPGIKNDTTILDAAKIMVDHTLRNGV
jgi:hypothetical protein